MYKDELRNIHCLALFVVDTLQTRQQFIVNCKTKTKKKGGNVSSCLLQCSEAVKENVHQILQLEDKIKNELKENISQIFLSSNTNAGIRNQVS